MYEDIKKKLQEIIDKEPVSNAINNDVISAYELSQIFCKEVKETLEALDAEKKVFAINQKYMIVNNLVRKISNIGKKEQVFQFL